MARYGGFGQALLALGSGLSGMADNRQREDELRMTRDSELAMRGLFAQAPKNTGIPKGGGEMSPMPRDTENPLATALMSVPGLPGGTGMGLALSGMRDRPAARPDATPVTPESIAAMQGALRSAKVAETPDTMNLFGREYEYRPEATPEGRRAAVQQQQREQQNRQSYAALRGQYDNIGEYNPGTDYGSVGQTALGSNLRTRIEPERNRRLYDALPESIRRTVPYTDEYDFSKTFGSYAGGEVGQQNRTEFRVMFPPQVRDQADQGVVSTAARRAQIAIQDVASDLVEANRGNAAVVMNKAADVHSPYRQYVENPETRQLFQTAVYAAAQRYAGNHAHKQGGILSGIVLPPAR